MVIVFNADGVDVSRGNKRQATETAGYVGS